MKQLKRWVVLGAAAAAMTVTGCRDTNRGQEGTGGAGGAGMEQGSGGAGDVGTREPDVGTQEPMEGTGGSGMMQADAGAKMDTGVGGTGGSGDVLEPDTNEPGTQTPVPEGQE